MKFVELLDPNDCESAIIANVDPPRIDKRDNYDGEDKWYVEAGAFVKLSDCSRWISWSLFDGYGKKPIGYNIKKIDKAINILCKIRSAMVKHQKTYERMKEIATEHNKKLKKNEA